MRNVYGASLLMAKKLTAAQVRKLTNSMNTSVRKLLNDKLDHGVDSNVKMSVQGIVDTGKRIELSRMLKRK